MTQTVIATALVTVTAKVTVTATATAKVTVTVTATPSSSPPASPTPTQSASPTPSSTPTPTHAHCRRPHATPTASPTGTPGCASDVVERARRVDGRGAYTGTANTGPNAPAAAWRPTRRSCTISTANVVIDSKVVNCRTLNVASGGGGLVADELLTLNGVDHRQRTGPASHRRRVHPCGARTSTAAIQVRVPATGRCTGRGQLHLRDPQHEPAAATSTDRSFTIVRAPARNTNGGYGAGRPAIPRDQPVASDVDATCSATPRRCASSKASRCGATRIQLLLRPGRSSTR